MTNEDLNLVACLLMCLLFGGMWMAVWRVGEFFSTATKTLKGELPLTVKQVHVISKGKANNS